MRSTRSSTHLNKQKTLNAVPETLNAVLSIIVNMPNNRKMVKRIGSITRQLDKERKKLVNGTQQNTLNEETNKKFQTFFNKIRHNESREFIPLHHFQYQFERWKIHNTIRKRLIDIYNSLQELTHNIEIENVKKILTEAQKLTTNINKNYTFTEYKHFFYDKKGHFNTNVSIKQDEYVNGIVKLKEKVLKLKIDSKILLEQIIEKLEKLEKIEELIIIYKKYRAQKMLRQKFNENSVRKHLQKQTLQFILDAIQKDSLIKEIIRKVEQNERESMEKFLQKQTLKNLKKKSLNNLKAIKKNHNTKILQLSDRLL